MRYLLIFYMLIGATFANDLVKGLDAISRGDYTQAKVHLQKACDEANPKACFGLGLMYYRGDGISQDYAKAASLYKKACEGNEALGCFNLAAMHDTGMGVPKDKKSAKKLFKKACDLNYHEGCGQYKLLVEHGF